MSIKLTTNFSLEELIYSEYAIRNNIDNTPDSGIIDNLKFLAIKLEAIRELFNRPLIISSGYRCPKLNYMIGGTANSSHQKGLAADFVVKDRYNEIFDDCKVIANKVYVLGIDQLIYEGNWIHVGFTKDKPRYQILTAKFMSNKVYYIQGLNK